VAAKYSDLFVAIIDEEWVVDIVYGPVIPAPELWLLR